MELVPFRTMAIDKKIIPFGFPLWLNTTHNRKNSKDEFNKIVIANDTGSAIKGVVRGDIFFGFGEEGENNATFQYSTGKYYLLIPNKIAKKYEK
jgi:membrane-bound lytic murein transglycosylase A